MGKWLKMYLAVSLFVLLAAMVPPVFAQGEELGQTGQAEVVSQAPPTRTAPEVTTTAKVAHPKKVEAPTVNVIPEFWVTFTGADADYATDRFQKYARGIGQKVRFKTSKYEVVWNEIQRNEGSRWLDLAQQLGRQISSQINVEDFQKVTLRATIIRHDSDGDENVWSLDADKARPNVRINTQYWSNTTSLNVGEYIEPYEKMRRQAIDSVIPELMVELQKTISEDRAEAAAQAAEAAEAQASGDPEVSHPAARTAVGTQLVLMGRTRTVSFRVSQGQRLKVMRGKRVVGYIRCNNTDAGKAWFDGEPDLMSLALEPNVTIQR